MLFVFRYTISCTLTSTLFPYTTLFRSPLGQTKYATSFSPSRYEPNCVAVLSRWQLPQRTSAQDCNAVWLISAGRRSEEHTSELQSLRHLVCRLLLEKKKKKYEHENVYN